MGLGKTAALLVLFVGVIAWVGPPAATARTVSPPLLSRAASESMPRTSQTFNALLPHIPMPGMCGSALLAFGAAPLQATRHCLTASMFGAATFVLWNHCRYLSFARSCQAQRAAATQAQIHTLKEMEETIKKFEAQQSAAK
eukprot:GHVT01031290.1.p2 GENE.GHVT01031290.1~~GHVT01031290.1.p2  ORF type:complete len:141 (-),score=21.95 GHVT01031290.1:618-1040(-)